MKTRVAITNTVLSNTGDAAIALSIMDLLRSENPEADFEFVVFDSAAAHTSKLYPELEIVQLLSLLPPFRPGKVWRRVNGVRVAIVRGLASKSAARRAISRLSSALFGTAFRRAIRALESVDLVISSGGTYLVDHYNFSARVAELELAKSLGKPVVLWTQSLGPFDDTRARRNATQIAEMADAVYFRDGRSKRSWESLGVPEGQQERVVAADSVFGIDTGRERNVDDRGALISVRKWKTTITGVPSDLKNYRTSVVAASRVLEERGLPVRALSTCQGVPSYGQDDSLVARDFFSGSSGVRVDGDFHDPYELLDELAGAKIVIATRMHFAILALISRVPVVAIAYEFKTIELFKSLGLGDYCIEIENVTPEWITERVTRLLDAPAGSQLATSALQETKLSAATPATSAVVRAALKNRVG